MRLAMIVEYDGAGYSGFQYQKNAPTVQEQIENTIESLTAKPVRIKAAGRTDSGVHALGQVVAFDTDAPYPPETVRDALNSRLPDDIAVRSVYRVRPEFDPRRDAVSRLYRYTLLVSGVRSPLARRWSHKVRGPLDLESMTQAAALMEGVHDFVNFAGPMSDLSASTIRRVHNLRVERDSDFIRLEVKGNAFLPHQVRRMVGALVDVGIGKLSIEQIGLQIAGRADAPTARSAPPHGLCLVHVEYTDFPPGKSE
jgi:tRNA pseudouridine38-40 synthase